MTKIYRTSDNSKALWLINQGVSEWQDALVETTYHGEPVKLIRILKPLEKPTEKLTKKLRIFRFMLKGDGNYAITKG